MNLYSNRIFGLLQSMTDKDRLRQIVRDTESKICELLGDDPASLEFGPTTKAWGETVRKVGTLLDVRRCALNQMFTASQSEVERFAQVNEYLAQQCQDMLQRTANMYRTALKAGPDGGFCLFTTIEGTVKMNYSANSSLRETVVAEPMDNDEYYGSDFNLMMALACSYTEYMEEGAEPLASCYAVLNSTKTPDMTDEQLIDYSEGEDGESWGDSEGEVFGRSELSHINKSHAAWRLCTHCYYSIPDLLRIKYVRVAVQMKSSQRPDIPQADIMSTLEQHMNSGDERQLWQYIDCLCASEDVYSAKIDGHDTPIYLFATQHRAALVMMDDQKGEELADEEPFGREAPMYFSETSYRVSPVHILASVARDFRSQFPQMQLSSYLLTTAYLINGYDLEEKWRKLGIGVRHKMQEVNCSLTTSSNAGIALAASFDKFAHPRKASANSIYVEAESPKPTRDDVVKMLLSADGSLSNRLSTPQKSDNGDKEVDDDEQEQLPTDDYSPFGSDDAPPPVRVLKYMPGSREKLNAMVGLRDVKAHIDNLLSLATYNQKKEQLDSTSAKHKVNLHSIFTGPVGVGKTTVAQLYGSLLHDAQVLSKGHVVVCERGTFVGRNFGDEEKRVAQVMDMAKGGVLFIDEAYLLASNHPHDPSYHILPLMLNMLADEKRRDIAVVLAGYDKPMEDLLDTNPGLASRFVNHFQFKNFSVDELLEITKIKVEPYHYTFTPAAWTAYRQAVEKAYRQKGGTFGNGRFVANLLETVYLQHASRCVAGGIFDAGMMQITPDDIPHDVVQHSERRIGFSAC